MGNSASSCSPGFRGQRLSLICCPRTVGSAPHQGACADLNRGFTWACRRLRRACSCSVRVSSACHGVHRAGTSSVLRRASTSTGVLRACVFSLCRTFCNCNREFQFSPCRAHRLHLHLWWSTSRQHQQCYCTCACHGVHRAGISSVLRRASRGTEALCVCACSLCRTSATATNCFGSFSVVPTVSTFTCGKVHRASTGSVCCTCACRGKHRACTSSVLGRASTGTGLLGASAFSLCRTYCDYNIWLRFSPCRAHRLHLHLWCNTSRRYHRYTWHLHLSWTTSRQHLQGMLHLHFW